MKKAKKNKGLGLIIVLLIILIILSAAAVYLYFAIKTYEIKQFTFEGTSRYSEAQLKSYVFEGMNVNNMLKLKHDLKEYEKVSIPFIETYEISLEFPDHVHVVFYEKKIVAYVMYKDNYMYFDKDGIIVETSNSLLTDVPYVDGLDFDSIVLYNPLPVKDEEVFDTILDLSQCLLDVQITVDKIHFENDLSIVLYIGDVRVNLGGSNKLAEKINEVKNLIPEFDGLKGVLHMEKFEEGKEFITFKLDK